MPAKRSTSKQTPAQASPPSSAKRQDGVSARLSRTLQRMSEEDYRKALDDAAVMMLVDLAHRQRLAFPKARRNAQKNSQTRTELPQ